VRLRQPEVRALAYSSGMTWLADTYHHDLHSSGTFCHRHCAGCGSCKLPSRHAAKIRMTSWILTPIISRAGRNRTPMSRLAASVITEIIASHLCARTCSAIFASFSGSGESTTSTGVGIVCPSSSRPTSDSMSGSQSWIYCVTMAVPPRWCARPSHCLARPTHCHRGGLA
jgi:hypothetical protein